MNKKIFRAVFIFLAVLPFLLKCEDLFRGEGVIFLPPPEYKGSGIYEKNNLLSLSPIDAKNFLVLWKYYREKEKGIVDKEKIKKEAIENKGIVKSINPYEILEANTYLSIINDKGKIIMSSSPKEAKVFSGKSFPLILEQSENCPYAVLSNGKIDCFGLSLEDKKSYSINFDLIESAKATFDGKIHTLWIFGKTFNKKFEFKEKTEYDFREPLKPVKLGKRFLLEKGKEEELPFGFNDLFNSISKIAKSPEGEKVKLDPSFINIKVFDDLEYSPGIFLLIEASEVKESRNISQFKGTTLFFRIYVDDYGIGKVQQLHFWISRDKVKEVYFDKEKSVLYIPEMAIDGKSKVFSLGKNGILYYIDFSAAFPDEKGEYETEKGFEVMRYFLYFPSDKETPEIYNFYDEVWPKIEEDLTEDESSAVPMFGLYARIDKNNFLFKGVCGKKKEKKDCFIIASIQK